MKKLDEIEKKDIFAAPDDYFEKLPELIQSRAIAAQKRRTYVAGAIKFALPSVVFVLAIVWFIRPAEPAQSPEDLLASVSSADIAEYLNTMEMTPEDFLESINYEDIVTDSLNLEGASLLLDDVDYSEFLNDMDYEILNQSHE